MALLCATSLVFAQNSTQTALLQHGDVITTFYGADAFADAYNAAASTGDIITLSSGTFNAHNLGKAITLRGVGCVSDDELNTLPTIIAGDFQTWNSYAPAVLTVEGIFFDGIITVNGQSSPVFIRCNINEIKWGSDGSSAGMYDAEFINCRIRLFKNDNLNNTTFRNCAVFSCGSELTDPSSCTIQAYNSYIWLADVHQNLSAYNSIIGGSRMEGMSVAYNCISWGSVLEACSHHNCWVFDQIPDVFETFDGVYFHYVWETEPFILKGEVAAQCLGLDGTQVGINGGNMPYSARPTYMTTYRTTVDQHSNPDGKLNVHIEVVE